MKLNRLPPVIGDFMPLADDQIIAHPKQDLSLFRMQKEAVRRISNAYYKKTDRKDKERTEDLQLLLDNRCTKVNSLSSMQEGGVYVVHRTPTQDLKIKHGFIFIYEQNCAESALLSMFEVSIGPRHKDNELLLLLYHSNYPQMGIYKSWGYHNSAYLNYFIEKGQVYKVDISADDIEHKAKELCLEMKQTQSKPAHSVWFNCNNFVYDTLKKAIK